MAEEKTISRRASVQVAFNGVDITITAKVKNVGEAKKLAEKYLRLANKYAKTAEFELPGNPALPAGVTVELAGFGGWDGKYLVKTAKHEVGDMYSTNITLRGVLKY